MTKILRAKSKNQLPRKQIGRPRGSIKIADRLEVRSVNMPITWTTKDQSIYDSFGKDKQKHIRNVGYTAVKQALYENSNQLIIHNQVAEDMMRDFEEYSIEEQDKELDAVVVQYKK